MTDEPEGEGSLPSIIAEQLGGIAVPAVVQRNFFKAFTRLCTAAVDIPVAHLEGKAAETRAVYDGRVTLINSSAAQIAEQMKLDPAYARAAATKYGHRIVREQVNLDEICEKAARRVAVESEVTSSVGGSFEPKEISDQFLNHFEEQARPNSSEEMKELFARILAREIIAPESFDTRTLRAVGELDSQTAKLFQILCSASISLRIPNGLVLDTRMPSIGNAASNSLQRFGLDFRNLNRLLEHGLIISDLNSFMPYKMAVANEQMKATMGFDYMAEYYGLIPIGDKNSDDLRLHGVQLSNVGLQLAPIVDRTEVDGFVEALKGHFVELGYEMAAFQTSS